MADLLEFETTTDNLLLEDGTGVLLLEVDAGGGGPVVHKSMVGGGVGGAGSVLGD